MKKTTQKKGNIVIYQAPSGAIELRGDISKATIWATQAQIASAFEVNVRTVNEHIMNIYNTAELGERSTVRKFRIVQNEGKRQITRDVLHYNLDIILSVGYRVNSKKATFFRQWATKTLREHITKGYTINRTRLSQNYTIFTKAIGDMRTLIPTQTSELSPQNVLDLISAFADTWISLDAYDKDDLKPAKVTKKKVTLTAGDLSLAIDQLKQSLIKSSEATAIFAQERSAGAIEGIIGNIMQSFGGKELYPSLESKSAHLLYFMIKNHPFTDGNKRSAAFAFVWFLRRAGLLNLVRLTPSALTSLTLLLAESNPKDKDKMVNLVMMLLGR